MSWVRLSDDFASRPALVAQGPIAFSVAVWALCESSSHLTDGKVSLGMLRGCPWVSKRSALDRACEALEGAGFWKRTADGYRIVKPTDYLQKATVVREKRRQAAARQAAWRERQQALRNAPSNALRGKAVTHPPTPTPKGRGGKPASLDAAGTTHDFCPQCTMPAPLHVHGCVRA